jgi:hypothetical protein
MGLFRATWKQPRRSQSIDRRGAQRVVRDTHRSAQAAGTRLWPVTNASGPVLSPPMQRPLVPLNSPPILSIHEVALCCFVMGKLLEHCMQKSAYCHYQRFASCSQ